MVSEKTCNADVPGCKRCGLGPDEAIHRLHPGHQTHAFALTAGEAIAGRLTEAQARAPYAPPTIREISPQEAERLLRARAPGLLAGVRAGLIATFESQLEANESAARAHMASCDHCSTSEDGDLCSESEALYQEYAVLTGEISRLRAPRLHQVLNEHLGARRLGPDGPSDEDLRSARLAIADALRARLAGLHELEMRAALDDFFIAPEVR